MSDLVKMTHSDLGEAGPVTRRAFETVWAPKGWTIVQDDGKATSRPARRTRAQTTKEQS